VSLAQQVEQRETLAIQYTIELRRMLNEVPVQEGVRQFLFQVWADVLATSAVRYGGQSEPDQDHEARRRRPDLVGQRQGHPRRACRGHPPPAAAAQAPARGHGLGRHGAEKQDEHMNALNNALAAAFTAKAAVIPNDRLQDLMERLERWRNCCPTRPTSRSTNPWCSTCRATRA
jgi:hypothetical protein